MQTFLGIARLSIAFPAIAISSLLILLAALIPIRIQNIRLAPWLCTLTSRLAFAIFNIRVVCPEPQKFVEHKGFVFPNHITFFDILMMLQVLPMRFLSALENRSWPFIGWVAIAVGTVFVDRSNKESRAAAREALAKAEKYPPIVIYPEGGIGPANGLRPFRYGSFEIAVENEIPFLPTAIVYKHPEVVVWADGEAFIASFWRAACFPGPMHAQVIPLTPVHPKLGDDPKQLAVEAHRAVAAALGVQSQM